MKMDIVSYDITRPTQPIYELGTNPNPTMFVRGKTIITINAIIKGTETQFLDVVNKGNLDLEILGPNEFLLTTEETKLLLSELQEVCHLVGVQEICTIDANSEIVSLLLGYITELKNELKSNNSSGRA